MLLENPIVFKSKKPSTLAPVVILHGLLGRARNMRSVAEGLSEIADVYAFDLRGHGDSDHGGDILIYEMATDVVQTCKSLGLEKVNLLGHSLGGKIAMAICLSDLSKELKVENIIVADIAPAPSRHGNGELLDSLLTNPLPDFERSSQATTYVENIVKNRDLAAWLAQNIIPGSPAKWSCDMKAIRAGIEAMDMWPIDDTTHIKEDSCWPGRALFIHGGNSGYVGDPEKEAIKKYFPQAEIKTLENTGHWLHIEQRQLFLNTVKGFLESR